MPMVEIASYHDPGSADLAKAKLASEGIEALLLNRNTASLFGGALMPTRLMVLPEDEAAAFAILKEFLPKK